MHKPSILPLIAAAMVLGACGGGGSSAPSPVVSPPPPPAPPPPPPPPAPDFSAVQARIDASSVANMAVLVGDETGVLYSYEKGSFETDQSILIASASKMVFGLTVWTLVEDGRLSETSQPQDFISFWTNIAGDGRSDVTLDQLLGFTSGFNQPPGNPGCISNLAFTLSACVQQIYDGGLESAAGAGFYYGPEHMQVAALMVAQAEGQSFESVMRAELLDPLGVSSATRYALQAGENTRYSGNMRSTAADYAILLTAFLNGDVVSDRAGYLRDRLATAFIGHRPGATNQVSGDWHYGFGFWKECDDLTYSAACDTNPTISSPGAFGFTPWIDLDKGYWGIIAMAEAPAAGFDPAAVSVSLEQELQPLIEMALGL